jgi:nitrate/nitrite transport system ATP-binding protein
MSKPFLQVEDLAQRYPGGRGQPPLVVFEGLNFGVERGELVAMIGHSGCGKSTVLNAVAGLSRPSAGFVFVGGKLVQGPSISRGVIFQNHSLLPWKTALGNVAFSVRARWPDWSRDQVRAHSLRYLHMVGLKHGAENRRPAQLSGGMRQRVGIARAFAIQPEVLLMDEPFGALDALTRSTVQDELLSLWRDSGSTVFLITHDIDEAVYLADRVLLMSEGPNARLAEQVDIPLPRPRDRASLLKDPTYFQVRARLVDFLYGRNSTNTEGANHGQERHETGRPRRQEGERVELGQAG